MSQLSVTVSEAHDIDYELLIDNHRSGARQRKLLESRHSSITRA